MIDRVYDGYRPGGLIKYLFGPGRFNEHENPRAIATWDGRHEAWQPPWTGPGEHDFSLARLIAAMQAPAKAARLPVTNPEPDNPKHRRFFQQQPDGSLRLREGYVWNLILRNDDQDRILTDAEWRHIAEEMMHRSGVARRDDPGGCRWVAVRHDDTGIHIAVTLVRQDTARRFYPKYYRMRLREAVEAMERRYGLVSTAPADQTAAANPTRGETEKAARQGKVSAREELAAAVRQAAAVSWSVEEIFDRLQHQGYLVEQRRLPSRDVVGYKIARPGDVNRAGTPIWYPGSKLARDLSLQALRRRCEQAQRGRARAGTADNRGVRKPGWQLAVVERTRLVLREHPDQADGIAHALCDVLTALETDGSARLVFGAGCRFDRAARAPRRAVPDTGVVAEELRWMARRLGTTKAGPGLELAAALAALVLQIAAIQQDRQRVHQARATRQAAGALTRPPQPRAVPRPAQPTGKRRPSRTSRGFLRSTTTDSRQGATKAPRSGASSPHRRWSPPRRDGPGSGQQPQR